MTEGGVMGPDDEGADEEENERAGIGGAGAGEYRMFLYAKRTCFGFVDFTGIAKVVGCGIVDDEVDTESNELRRWVG